MLLSEKIVAVIRKTEKELQEKNELLSRAQVAEYCGRFKERFSPEKLSTVSGIELAELIHNVSNKDSLAYWLEFKNDDEFTSIFFGSVTGGSALKYGIYKRKETGAWMTGSSRDQHEISEEEAATYASGIRGQLTKAAEALKQLPEDASDDAYDGLQSRMEEIAPLIVHSAWGHKYLFLLYPNKLEDYHVRHYQRFYLMKLLLLPPERQGRYVQAGKYVRMAKELDIPMPNLTTILGKIYGRPHDYWRIGTKLGGKESIWDLMKEEGCIAVGWSEVPDLREFSYNREDKEAIKKIVAEKYPSSPQSVGRSAHQLFAFATTIQEGDYVIPSDGEKVLGVGQVIGDYYFVAANKAPHRRPVKWLGFFEWKTPEKEGLRTTIHQMKKSLNIVGVEEQLSLQPPSPEKIEETKTIAPTHKVYTGIIGRIQSVLERKSQTILYGPPGTGKTYWAEAAAKELCSYAAFRKPYAELDNKEKEFLRGEGKGGRGLVRTCAFHPAYGYEDFIEGYRPVTINGALTFRLMDGIFKAISQDAAQNSSQSYYLIIDEINRGDIPRIFGELMSILEKDKRGKRIILPLSGMEFFVPENLFIIGTMNTADRSIALLDTALRRRFGFVELMPDPELLEAMTIEGVPLGPWLSAVNKNIRENVGRDARNLQIGHSFLMESGRPINSFGKLQRVIREDILPLIQEYCYEDYGIITKIIGKSFLDPKGQGFNSELFKPEKKDEFVTALKAVAPEIDYSAPVLKSETEMNENDDTDADEEEEDVQGKS